MAARFNPAPGWPRTPEGWTPPRDWKPDPAWPPAPAGWLFWTEDAAVAPATALPRVGPGTLAASALPRPSTTASRRWRLPAAVGVGGLILGLMMGGAAGGASAGGASPAAMAAVARDLETVEAERDEAQEESEALHAAAADQVRELEARESDVAALADALATREAALVPLEADVQARLAAIEAREAELAAAALVTAAPVAPAVPVAPVAPAVAEPEAQPASVYYDNCAAARAAGAAPVRIGDPGYRSGLDRDGDGVGCES